MHLFVPQGQWWGGEMTQVTSNLTGHRGFLPPNPSWGMQWRLALPRDVPPFCANLKPPSLCVRQLVLLGTFHTYRR